MRSATVKPASLLQHRGLASGFDQFVGGGKDCEVCANSDHTHRHSRVAPEGAVASSTSTQSWVVGKRSGR